MAKRVGQSFALSFRLHLFITLCNKGITRFKSHSTSFVRLVSPFLVPYPDSVFASVSRLLILLGCECGSECCVGHSVRHSVMCVKF